MKVGDKVRIVKPRDKYISDLMKEDIINSRIVYTIVTIAPEPSKIIGIDIIGKRLKYLNLFFDEVILEED